MASSVGGKGGRKIGRGLRKPAHARYVNEGRRELNKIKRLKKHIKQFTEDLIAYEALKKLRGKRILFARSGKLGG